jgi:hypothetical protein
MEERDRVTKAWVDAVNRLNEDPNAKVICPVKGDANLQFMDAPFPGGFERYIYCPVCGAREVALFRKAPS